MLVLSKSPVRLLAFLVCAGIALGGEPDVGDKYAAGALRGVTRDPDGRPLPQAQVTVHSVAGRSVLTVVSGNDGAFSVASLNPGQYQVSAQADGFATVAASTIVVTNHQTAQMDLSLARSPVGTSNSSAAVS